MAEQTTRTDADLIAELNDLLQLDHDAVQAYTLAIDNLEDEGLRQTLRGFRGDHERHIEELTWLIRNHGGMPMELAHIPTGFFKLAVQKAGTLGGDKGILLAYKANEGQVRDKYQRHALRPDHPEGIAEVLRGAAADEDRHYTWVVDTLTAMGVDPESATGRVEETFERVHGRTADAVEAAGRKVM
jgi:hypothetical protein